MINLKPVPPIVGLMGSLFCSLAIAVEFAVGFYHRGPSLNLVLGLAWLLVIGFALSTYRARGLWVLLSAPVAFYLILNSAVQITVACSLNSQNCP